MKDTELRAQLIGLGMPASKADEVTRNIRDVMHPIAATAAAKMRDHQNAMEMQATYGDAGLSGYEYDGVSGLLKSVKKVAKKAVKVVKKVALPVVAAVAAPFTGGASLALLATTGAVAAGSTLLASGAQKKAQKKATKKGNAAIAAQIQPGMVVTDIGGGQYRVVGSSATQITLQVGSGTMAISPQDFANKYSVIPGAAATAAAPAPVTAQPVTRNTPWLKKKAPAVSSSPKTPPAQTMNDPSVPPVVAVEESQTQNLSERIGKYRRVKVPKPLADVGGQVAAQAMQQGYPADPAALMQAMLQNQGTNMVSPAAQDVVRAVAAQGVEQTPQGPSALPSWALPAGGAALLLLLLSGRRK